MVRHFKKSVCMLFGAAALISLSPSPAKAQHVVTEMEASKLTFESLTAAPAVRHHKVRKVSYKASSNRNNSSRFVRNISYKQKGKLSVKNAVYKSSSHKKSTRNRHRS